MSNIAMKAFRILSTLLVLLSITALAACSFQPSDPDLPLGRPVIDAILSPPHELPSHLEIAARPPGVAAWRTRLDRKRTPQGGEKDAVWKITNRSDGQGVPDDLADSKLVDHFLEVLGTFVTEAPADHGNDATFGLNPYRMEIQIGESPEKALQLGDAAGPNGIYFRIGPKGKVWIGRGALVLFLPTLETPDHLVDRSPFFAALKDVQSVRLEKLLGKDRAAWEFSHSGEHWMLGKTPLSEENSTLLERIFRQRLIHVLPVTDLPDFHRPDWSLKIRTPRGEETLELTFSLNQVFAKNPERSNYWLELFPEFAGALKAFTQARLTPVKSGTKK